MGLNLDNISIILVQPQIPENIGAAARAMNNMGLTRLVLVEPENCDLTRILKMATGTSIDIVEAMEVYDDFLVDLHPYQYVIGTTARTGAQRPALTNPRELAQALIPISRANSVAVLFGPEDRGLSNEHLRYCHTIATIPTSLFASLNLSQAVMIVSYEIFLAASQEETDDYVPRLANKFELEGMYDHLKAVLMRIGFIDEPTSGLDPKAAEEFLEILQELRGEGKAILMSTHDIFWAKVIGDRVGVMKEGRPVLERSREELGSEDLVKIYIDYVKSEPLMA